MYIMTLKAVPLASEDLTAETVLDASEIKLAGAYINAWVNAAGEAEAQNMAFAEIRKAGWQPQALIDARQYAEMAAEMDMQEWEASMQQAQISDCYLMVHPWSEDAPDGDVAYENLTH